MILVRLSLPVLALVSLVPALAFAQAPPTLDVDLGGGTKLALVLVPAGTFTQGSAPGEAGRSEDERAHRVTLGNEVYIGKFPVTRGQFARLVAQGREERARGGALPQHAGQPQRRQRLSRRRGHASDGGASGRARDHRLRRSAGRRPSQRAHAPRAPRSRARSARRGGAHANRPRRAPRPGAGVAGARGRVPRSRRADNVSTAERHGTSALRAGRDLPTGRLVPRGDVEALAAALVELGNDPTKRAAMGAAGRERAEARFDARRMVADYRRICLGR